MQAARAAEDTPFRLYRGYLIVAKCSVGSEHGLTAIVDTGTTETILDLPIAQRLGLDARRDSATAVSHEAAAWSVSIPQVQLGPLGVERLDGIAMDLSFVSGQLGVHLDVVIGMDLLRRSNFAIDYGAQVIHFGPSEALAHAASVVPGRRFVIVESSLSGRPLRLQVDTGFNGLLLYGRRLPGLLQAAAADGARVSGVAQASSVKSMEASDVRVGNWRGAHLIVSVMDGGPRDFDEFDGLLGPRLLAKRRVAFDFEHGMVYWD